MGMPKDRRREIDTHAAAWASELIDEYGPDADRVMLSCLQHPGYGAGERYCFRQVRQALRRRGIPAAHDARGLRARLAAFLAVTLDGRSAARG